MDINITLVDEDINEAEESFLVIIDRNVIIPEDFPTFLRDGIALVNIENDDRKLSIITSNYGEEQVAVLFKYLFFSD